MCNNLQNAAPLPSDAEQICPFTEALQRKHPVTPFMRKPTEDGPYAHTPALWQWSSCPSQCCRPSFQHPQFPI